MMDKQKAWVVIIQVVAVTCIFVGSSKANDDDKVLVLFPYSSRMVLEPGSQDSLELTPSFHDLDAAINDVGVVITLPRGEKSICLVCLSPASKSRNGTCNNTCSFNVTRGVSIDLMVRYNATRDPNTINSSRELSLEAKSKANTVAVKPIDLSIIAQDGRKLMVGFDGPLYRLTQNSLSFSVVKFNKSLNIDTNLTVQLTLWKSVDGVQWEEELTQSVINVAPNEIATNWTTTLSNLEEGYFYETRLSTSLEIVNLQPNLVKIYPSSLKLMCGKNADDVKGLVGDLGSQLDEILQGMCGLVEVTAAPTDEATTIPTEPPTDEATTIPTDPPTNETTTVLTDPPTNETITVLTDPLTNETTTVLTDPPTNETITVSTKSSAAGNKSNVTTTPIPPTPTTVTTPIDSDNTADSDATDAPVMWWAFFGFLALLVVGVSGYLLFNHHAKVKVYLFQLVGKGGSTVSAMTSRRGRAGIAKYSPLPTNVRETMLHQD